MVERPCPERSRWASHSAEDIYRKNIPHSDHDSPFVSCPAVTRAAKSGEYTSVVRHERGRPAPGPLHACEAPIVRNGSEAGVLPRELRKELREHYSDRTRHRLRRIEVGAHICGRAAALGGVTVERR